MACPLSWIDAGIVARDNNWTTISIPGLRTASRNVSLLADCEWEQGYFAMLMGLENERKLQNRA